jgi:hypothetical protein
MTEQHEDEIVHRTLETERDEPLVQVAEIVADFKEVDADTLDSAYRKVDHLLDNVFSDPPSPDAQVQITFSYEGYRITVEQNGEAKFVKATE